MQIALKIYHPPAWPEVPLPTVHAWFLIAPDGEVRFDCWAYTWEECIQRCMAGRGDVHDNWEIMQADGWHVKQLRIEPTIISHGAE